MDYIAFHAIAAQKGLTIELARATLVVRFRGRRILLSGAHRIIILPGERGGRKAAERSSSDKREVVESHRIGE